MSGLPGEPYLAEELVESKSRVRARLGKSTRKATVPFKASNENTPARP